MIRYHPGSSQAAWEYKKPTNQWGGKENPWREAGCGGGNAAHPREQQKMRLEKTVTCLPPAPHRVPGMAPPNGNSSPSSAAKHVKIETAGGEWYALPRPALA